MAQSGFTPVQLYRSTTAAAVPLAANLAAGELAINLTDEKLYFENASGVVKVLADSTYVGTVTSVAASGGTTGLTFSGSPITSSGTLTLSGTLAVTNGGTGATTLTGVVKGNGTSAFTAGTVSLTSEVSGTLPVSNGGTGVTTSTGTVAVVLSNSPTLVTPNLGTPSAVTLTNATGLPLATGVTGTLPVANGGTGQTTYTNGQLLIGNTTGNTLTKATLTAGTNISITNGAGAITINSTDQFVGTVTSVSGTGTVSGITLTGTVTTSGSLTLGGTLAVTPSNFASQTANTFLAAPNGAPGVPTFRAIVAADVPTLNQNTTGTAANVTGIVAVANGGTGLTSTPANGAIDIGNGTGFTRATLTAGSGVSITNGIGSITISATGSGGTVTSVSGTGTVNGITLTGTVTSSGSLTLGGTLSGVSLTTQVSGTLPVANGGTGVTTSTGTTSVVLSNSPVLVTPTLGAASATSIANGLGAVGTPSYTFTGDLNTGMWSPSADAVAFSTAGAERMRLDSSGNVGIGTTAPATRLHVAGTGSGPTLRLENQTASTGKTYDIISGDGGPLRFQDITAGAERMRITDTGNVGIGTSSPGAKLDVNGTVWARADASAIGIDVIGRSADNGGQIRFLNNAASASLGTLASYGNDLALLNNTASFSLLFGTNSTERMRIDSSGNVGIGTSAPSFKLDIQGSSAQTARVYCTDSASGSYAAFNAANANGVSSVMYSFSGAGWYGTTSNHPTLFLSNNAERMRIDSSGNVGIGTTSPGAKLDVLGISLARTDASGGNSPLVAKNDSTANNTTKSTGLLFQGVDTTGAGKSTALVQCGPSDSNYVTSYLAFQTRTADALNERMRITDTGNVGIGTSSPTLGKLVVSQASSGTATLALESQGSWNASIAVNSSGNLIFNNNAATERMRIDSSGNVGIGTTSPGYRLDVASGDTTASIGYAMRIRSNATATAAAMQFTNSGASSQTGLLACTDTGTMTLQSDGASSILAFRTNGNERMRIDSSGNVGIGTSSVNARLSLGALVSNKVFALYDDGTNQYGMGIAASQYRMFAATGGSLCFGNYARSTDTFTETVRITSDGKVGIGTSSPDATAILDVSSTTAGFLPPRMSTAERDAIGGGAPQEGLILFNVTTDKLQVFSAGAWVNLH